MKRISIFMFLFFISLFY